jgi:hypothetical protein
LSDAADELFLVPDESSILSLAELGFICDLRISNVERYFLTFVAILVVVQSVIDEPIAFEKPSVDINCILWLFALSIDPAVL